MALWWVNGDLLQEGLRHTQACCTQSPCPRSSLLLTQTPQEIPTHSSVSVSVGSLGLGVHKVCLSPLSLGFYSKCEFAPPTILLFFHTIHRVLKARILSTEELMLLNCGVGEDS